MSGQKKNHCSHSAALFLLSLLEDSSQDSEQVGYVPPGENQEHRPPAHLGVGVEKFGTIIKSPSKLINSSPKATYTNLNYCLVGGSSTQMSSPEKFMGRLVLSLFFNNDDDNFTYQIKHQDENGQVNKFISIFEKLYLFDWLTGKTYILPNEIKKCIEKLLSRNNFTTDLFLTYFNRPNFSDYIGIEVNNELIEIDKLNEVALKYQ